MTEKTRSTRLRRAAERQGYELHKSRRRDPNALGFDGWMLTDPRNSNAVLIGGDPFPFSASIDDVEEFLTAPR